MKEKYKKIFEDKKLRLSVKLGAVALSCITVTGCFMHSTFAWLAAKSEQVVNTFTIGNIDISLQENGASDENKDNILEKEYHFVPGSTLEKDPSVTVKKGSEKCYLFVHVEEENNTHEQLQGNIIQWSVDTTAWKPVLGEDETPISGYWYRIIEKYDEHVLENQEQGKKLYILKGNTVTVNKDVTKEMADTINTTKPALAFEAAAIQFEGMKDVLEAWNNLPDDFKK